MAIQFRMVELLALINSTLLRIRLLAVLMISLPRVVAGQETDPEAAELDEAIDEITVVGARELGVMRARVEMAEDQVFEIFNDLNEDDGYDIICKRETRIGSQIPKRVCLARMYRDSLADMTEDEEAGGLTIGRMPRSEKHQKILSEKMRALSKEHPELREALIRRHRFEKEFQEAREQKFGE